MSIWLEPWAPLAANHRRKSQLFIVRSLTRRALLIFQAAGSPQAFLPAFSALSELPPAQSFISSLCWHFTKYQWYLCIYGNNLPARVIYQGSFLLFKFFFYRKMRPKSLKLMISRERKWRRCLFPSRTWNFENQGCALGVKLCLTIVVEIIWCSTSHPSHVYHSVILLSGQCLYWYLDVFLSGLTRSLYFILSSIRSHTLPTFAC